MSRKIERIADEFLREHSGKYEQRSLLLMMAGAVLEVARMKKRSVVHIVAHDEDAVVEFEAVEFLDLEALFAEEADKPEGSRLFGMMIEANEQVSEDKVVFTNQEGTEVLGVIERAEAAGEE